MHQRLTLSDSISQIDQNTLELNENLLINKLLLENPKYSVSIISYKLMASKIDMIS